MSLSVVPHGIVLGSGWEFSPPTLLAEWAPPARDGVYVILTLDSHAQSVVRVLYVGQTQNFEERGFPNGHHKAACWKKHAGGKPLYVATFLTFGLEGWRRRLEASLLQTYDPPCNDYGCA